MSQPLDSSELGHPFRNKRRRKVLLIVVVASVAVHVLSLLVFGVITIVETISKPPPEFEAVVEVAEEAPPPPPPPPTQRTTQRSMPRPQPMAVQNALNLSIPAIEIDTANMVMGLTGHGSGGGFGSMDGGALESIRLTAFGFDQYIAGTLEGNLYDFKQAPDGSPIEQSKDEVVDILKQFTRSSWSTATFDKKYFRADKSLYSAYFIIPYMDAAMAPDAFGAAAQIEPKMIAAVYRGTFVAQRSGKFRFYGRGDDVLVVRLNNHIVLDASWDLGKYSEWKSSAPKGESEGKPQFGFREGHPGIYGDWFTLREGQEVNLEVLLSEVPGGRFGAWLLLDEKGSEEKPVIFTTRPLSDQDREHLSGIHPDAQKFL